MFTWQRIWLFHFAQTTVFCLGQKKQEKSNWHGYLSTCLIAATIFENKLVNLQNIQVKFINSTLGSYSRIHSRTYSFISNMFLGQNTREIEHIASIPTGKKNPLFGITTGTPFPWKAARSRRRVLLEILSKPLNCTTSCFWKIFFIQCHRMCLYFEFDKLPWNLKKQLPLATNWNLVR